MKFLRMVLAGIFATTGTHIIAMEVNMRRLPYETENLPCAAQIAFHLAIKNNDEQALQNLLRLYILNDRDTCNNNGSPDLCTPFLPKAPLIEAARYGNPDTIKTLLRFESNIDQQTIDGNTALMVAAAYGKIEAVQLLLQMGANRHLKTLSGKTAYDCALDHDKIFDPVMYRLSNLMLQTAKQYDSEKIAQIKTAVEENLIHVLNFWMDKYERELRENPANVYYQTKPYWDLYEAVLPLRVVASESDIFCNRFNDKESCKKSLAHFENKIQTIAEEIYYTYQDHLIAPAKDSTVPKSSDEPCVQTIAYTPEFFDDWYRDQCQQDDSGIIDNRTCTIDPK